MSALIFGTGRVVLLLKGFVLSVIRGSFPVSFFNLFIFFDLFLALKSVAVPNRKYEHKLIRDFRRAKLEFIR